MMDINAVRKRAEEALERAEKATLGPWDWGQGDNWTPVSYEEHRDGVEGPLILKTTWERPLSWGGPDNTLPEVVVYVEDILNSPDDAVFIAEARTDVPQLAQDLLEALEEIERLTDCLKRANQKAEHFEREWYLRGDEIEELKRYIDG